uniref:C2H2-type domain-containing protein n=1 Tax=Anguilla anguilla TaxID=7936 RepID=A0A0E9Q272_ANGAN
MGEERKPGDRRSGKKPQTDCFHACQTCNKAFITKECNLIDHRSKRIDVSCEN